MSAWILEPITLEELRLHARSLVELLDRIGATSAEEALLPPDFVARFLPAVHPDWVGVRAMTPERLIVGTGGYKGSPAQGEIEIGYGVSPHWEGQGVATAMAGWLTERAIRMGCVRVIAHTLPEGFASQKVLTKCGFVLAGSVHDPDDGEVLRWVFEPSGP